MTPQASLLLYLPPDRLKLHPQNMRRYYPPDDVAKMAASISASGGVYQALLITPDPGDPGSYWVIDGNMRLAGGKSLGPTCPPLKSEIILGDQAQQLLAMAATTEFHFPKDPISQAFHYQRLMEQEHLTIQAIAQQIGVSRGPIEKLLKLLELEPEIQEFIAQGKISPDVRITRALLDLPDSATRLRLARRFARNQTGIKHILRSCRFIVEQAARLDSADALHRLQLRRVQKQQAAARRVQARAGSRPRPRLDPEAARLIHNAADKTLCQNCRLTGLTEECYLCPGPHEFIDAVIELIEVADPDLQSSPVAANGDGLAAEKERLTALGRQLRADFQEAV